MRCEQYNMTARSLLHIGFSAVTQLYTRYDACLYKLLVDAQVPGCVVNRMLSSLLSVALDGTSSNALLSLGGQSRLPCCLICSFFGHGVG